MSKTKMPMKKIGQTKRLSAPVHNVSTYENIIEMPDEPRMAKVSITVDRGFVNFVDDYVQNHPKTNRSAIFDQALELWIRHVQERNDMACYAGDAKKNPREKKEKDDWTAIQTEAAKRIWP